MCRCRSGGDRRRRPKWEFTRQACSSHHQWYLDLLLMVRRVRWPSESGCRKSKGQIESLFMHQTWGKRLIISPMYIDSCLQPKTITQVHHKVSKNAFKVGGSLPHCPNSGGTWICFDFQLYFPSNHSDSCSLNCPNFGGHVFLTDLVSYLCSRSDGVPTTVWGKGATVLSTIKVDILSKMIKVNKIRSGR